MDAAAPGEEIYPRCQAMQQASHDIVSGVIFRHLFLGMVINLSPAAIGDTNVCEAKTVIM